MALGEVRKTRDAQINLPRAMNLCELGEALEFLEDDLQNCKVSYSYKGERNIHGGVSGSIQGEIYFENADTSLHFDYMGCVDLPERDINKIIVRPDYRGRPGLYTCITSDPTMIAGIERVEEALRRRDSKKK